MEKRELTREEKIRKNKRIAKRRKIKKFSKITFLILLISSVALFWIIKGFNALPLWILIILGVLFLIILLPLGVLALIPPIKNSLKIAQSIISVLLSALMIFGCVKLPGYKGALEKVFVKIPSEGEMNIVVYSLNEGGINSVADLSDKKVAIQNTLDLDYQGYAIKVVNKAISETGGNDIQIVETDTIYSCVDALYQGTADAILLNEAYAKIIQDNSDYKDFEERTKNVYTCTQKVKLNVNTAAVTNITKEPFIVGVTGVDEWGTASIKPTATPRSDVNMMIVVNPVIHQVLIITIPRDSYVGLTSAGEIFGRDKLTHATTLSNGMSIWLQTLNRVFETNINYYLRVNYSSIRDVVNALGGIDLNNPYEFSSIDVVYTDENDRVLSQQTKVFEEGNIHLNGEEALAYCRERYSLAEGDIGRNKHQAAVIKACIRKACSVSVITNVDSLLKAVEGKFTTNIEMNDVYALAQMQLDDMSDWEIVQYSVIGSPDWGMSYVAGEELSVVFLSETSINKAIKYISQAMAGQRVTIE